MCVCVCVCVCWLQVREVVEHLQEADTLNIDPSQIVLNVEPVSSISSSRVGRVGGVGWIVGRGVWVGWGG